MTNDGDDGVDDDDMTNENGRGPPSGLAPSVIHSSSAFVMPDSGGTVAIPPEVVATGAIVLEKRDE